MAEGTSTTPAVVRARDLTGWEVVDRAGEKVGSVSDVLLGRDGCVHFLDVESGFARKRHVLLPQHHLEWGPGKFIAGDWTKEQIAGLPPFDPDRKLDEPILAEMERAFPWAYAPHADEWLEPPAETRVVPLSEAKDFKLSSGAPDPRGWNVFGADGERLGTVSQLLVDPAALQVRYLDVDVLDDLFLLKDDRHVLIPLDRVDLKERGNDAWVQQLSAAEAARLPAYTGGAVRPAMERAVESAFEGEPVNEPGIPPGE